MRKIKKSIVALGLCMMLCITEIPTMVSGETDITEVQINAINADTVSEMSITVLNYKGGAYIRPETAALMARMEYEYSDAKHIFHKGAHTVIYDGQEIEYNDALYVRMENVLEQLTCAYTYSTELGALCYVPADSFVENLYLDCHEIVHGTTDFDLTWVSDTDFIWMTEVYNILGEWGFGQKRKRMEDTLRGIMTPGDMESKLLNAVAKGNKTVGTVSKLAKYAEEAFGIEMVMELFGSGAADIMNTYDRMNKLIPGLKISDYINLMQNSYNAQNASMLYVNSVKYGLYNNSNIENNTLYAATQSVYRSFEDNVTPLDVFLESAMETMVEGNLNKLLNDAMEEGLLYKAWVVELFKMFTDKALGMEKNAGAVLALGDCAEIQKEALQQYNNSYSIITPEYNDCNPLQMKYSMILYLRACQYAYEKYGSTGEQGAWCEEIMSPLIEEKLETLAAYSDEELTKEVDNENLDFELVKVTGKTDTEENSETVSGSGESNYAVDILGMHKDEVIRLAGEPEWNISRNEGNYLGYDKHLALVGYFDEEQNIYPEQEEYHRVYEVSFGVDQGNPEEYTIGRFPIAEGLFSDMTYEELLKAAKQQGYFVWENGHNGLNIYGEDWSIYFEWNAMYYDWKEQRTVEITIDLETAAPTTIRVYQENPEEKPKYAIDFLGEKFSYLIRYFGEVQHYREQWGDSSWAFAYGEFSEEDDWDYGNRENPYWLFEVSPMPDNYYLQLYSMDYKAVITKVYPGKELLFPLAAGIYPDMTAAELKMAAEQNGYEYVEDVAPQNDRRALKYIYILGPGWEITYKIYEEKTVVEVGRR